MDGKNKQLGSLPLDSVNLSPGNLDYSRTASGDLPNPPPITQPDEVYPTNSFGSEINQPWNGHYEVDSHSSTPKRSISIPISSQKIRKQSFYIEAQSPVSDD